MHQINSRTIDFNSVLRGANLLVAGATLLAFQQAQSNAYVDQETIVLAVLLGVQTHVALMFERRRRDPFVVLLAFSMIVYYSLRILTLTLYPFSIVFERYPYDAHDSNYALVFIIVANAFLYAGFFAVRFNDNQRARSGTWKATAPGRVVVLLIAAIVFGYLSGGYWTEDTAPAALNFLVIFFNPAITVLMALAYYFAFRQTLSKKFAFAIATLLAMEMTVHTLVGSRSAIVGFVQSCLYVALALGPISFRKKYLYLGIALLPVIVGLLVASFVISTYNRANRELGGNFDLSRAIQQAGLASEYLSLGTSLDLLLPPIFSRAGFFDYSAEIIAHREEYQAVINPGAYARSIVDNILTPGFDVYDQPKISNALSYAYMDLGTPSKVEVSEFYQSDQLGVYGEFYALFEYGCLPLLFLVAFTLKRIYVRLRSANPFKLVAKRAVVLFVFVKIIDSFGVDWIILETLPLVAAIVLYAWILSGKRMPVPDSGLPRALAG